MIKVWSQIGGKLLRFYTNPSLILAFTVFTCVAMLARWAGVPYTKYNPLRPAERESSFFRHLIFKVEHRENLVVALFVYKMLNLLFVTLLTTYFMSLMLKYGRQ